MECDSTWRTLSAATVDQPEKRQSPGDRAPANMDLLAFRTQSVQFL